MTPSLFSLFESLSLLMSLSLGVKKEPNVLTTSPYGQSYWGRDQKMKIQKENTKEMLKYVA